MMAQGPPNLTEFVLIEYPAVVKNPEKALETLGGIDAISKAHFSSGPLELRFQPENPFDSALIADRRSQSVVFSGQLNLVLRCRRRKKPLINVDAAPADESGPSSRRKGRGRKKATTTATVGQQEEEEEPMEIICLGFVSTVYSFKTIYDFQLLPLSNKTVNFGGKKVHHDLLPHLVPCDFLTSIAWWNQPLPLHQKAAAIEGGGGSDSGQTSSLKEEAQRFLPPYQFSRYNNPSKLLLHDEVDHRVARRHPSTGHGKSLRTERRALTICVNAKDPFPAAPTEEAIGDVDLRCKNTEHHRLLIQMFLERPLWSRVAIGYRTHIMDALLKIILAKYAFYIQSGPWGRLWCRFGYDPRRDPEARKYQSVMVSFKRNQLIPERQRLRANTTATTPTYGQFFDYIYRPKVLPDLRQMWYCICDVQLPAAQKICRRDFLDTLRDCDPMTGWLPGHRLAAIRRAIKEDVAQTSKRMGEGTEFLEEEEEEEEEMEDEEEDNDDFEEEDEFLEMEEEEEEESAFAAMETEFGGAAGEGNQQILDIE